MPVKGFGGSETPTEAPLETSGRSGPPMTEAVPWEPGVPSPRGRAENHLAAKAATGLLPSAAPVGPPRVRPEDQSDYHFEYVPERASRHCSAKG